MMLAVLFLLFAIIGIVQPHPFIEFKPVPENYSFLRITIDNVYGDARFAIYGDFRNLIETNDHFVCDPLNGGPIDPSNDKCVVKSFNSIDMVCWFVYTDSSGQTPIIVPISGALAWVSDPSTPQWVTDLLEKCLARLSDDDLKIAIFCNAGCAEPERVCIGPTGLFFPIAECQLDAIDIDAYNEAVNSTCIDEGEHDGCSTLCGNYEIPSSLLGWKYTVIDETDGENFYILKDDGTIFDTIAVSSFSGLEVLRTKVPPPPKTPEFIQIYNDTNCTIHVEIFDNLPSPTSTSITTFDIYSRLGELLEDIKVTDVFPTSGISQSIYDVAHHNHQLLPKMHCEVADSCGIGTFQLDLGCRRLHREDGSKFNFGRYNVEWCRQYIETLLPTSFQNPTHQLFSLATRFNDPLSSQCLHYGNACAHLDDISLDAKYYWKCRVFGTSEYTREACHVQYCPWPLCQISGLLTNGNDTIDGNNNTPNSYDNNNNNNNTNDKGSTYIPPFVKPHWSADNSTLLDYSMQRDVQCVYWDEIFVSEIVLPNYICEETLIRPHHFNLDDLITYYCNETSFLLPTTTNSTSDNDNEPFITTLTTTTTTTTITQAQTPPTSHSFYTTQIDGNDEPLLKCCANFKFGPNCDLFAQFTNIGIEWLNSTYSIKNVTTLKIPDQTQDNFYLTTSNLFLLYWDYYGPPTRYAHIYIDVFTTSQTVPVFKFPILLGRVAAGARGFTFPLDQTWFRELFTTQQELPLNFFSSITKFHFQIVSSTNVIGQYEVPVQFGCIGYCNSGTCDAETGKCSCNRSFTPESYCLFDSCDQIVPRLSWLDVLTINTRFNPGTVVTNNWSPCNVPFGKELGICYLDDTQPNGRVCGCSHDVMEFNAPIWTDADRQIPVTSADMTKFRNRPNCDVFPRCEDDDILNGAPKCLNGGYHPALYHHTTRNTLCQPTCECPNGWKGEQCEICSLNCIHGKPNDDCTKCICDTVPSDDEYRQRMSSSLQREVPHLTYFGEQCQFTRLFTTSIKFDELPPWYMQSQQSVVQWHAALLDDIMADSGIEHGQLHFSHVVERETKNNNGKKELEIWYNVVINDLTVETITRQTKSNDGLKQGLEEYQRNLTSIKLALKISKMQKEKEQPTIITLPSLVNLLSTTTTTTATKTSYLRQQDKTQNYDYNDDVILYNQMLLNVMNDFEQESHQRKAINTHLSAIQHNHQRYKHHYQHIQHNQNDLINYDDITHHNALYDIFGANNNNININNIHHHHHHHFTILENSTTPPSASPTTSLTLYDQWKKLQEQMEQTKKQQQENPTTYDPTSNGGYLINDLPLENSTSIPIINTPQEVECISIYLPGCPREPYNKNDTINLAIAIAVPVVIVIFFIIFLVILFWCKKNQKGFFAPKQKKKKRADLEMSSATTSLTICTSCQKNPATSKGKSASDAKSVTKSSISHRFKCQYCKHEYDYDASTGQSLPIGLGEAAIGDEIDTGEILPVGWVVMRDKASGKNYYYHEQTMTTRWNHPNDNSASSQW